MASMPPYSMDSLLAYDPDEERRRKATEDLKAAADLGRQQTQGSGSAMGNLGDMAKDFGSLIGQATSGLADLEFPGSKPRQIATPQPRPRPMPQGALPGPYGDTSRNEQNTAGLDRMQESYKKSTQSSPLMFSMGKGPLKAYDPNGPDIGAPGKGGLSMQPLDNNSSIEDWRSRVANPGMFEGAVEAAMRPEMDANNARFRALADDPFLQEQIQSHGRMAERAIPEQEKRAGIQDYYSHAMEINQGRQQELNKLRKNPKFMMAPPDKQAAMEQDLNAEFDNQEDALDFAYHGRTRRKQGLGL